MKSERTTTTDKISDRAREVEAQARRRHLELGARGEDRAAEFLERHGLYVIERNWRCPAGEVDIIARDDFSIHFIEVKTRTGTGKGFPEEAVNREKRRKYECIAEYYLREYECCDISVHFDVVAIITTGPERAFLRLHNDAFCQG